MAKELKLYLPMMLQNIAEYKALSTAESPIIEDIESRINSLVDDSFLTTMSESRLREWEDALGIVPSNTSVEQRRSLLLSRFRGTGKLNSTLIKAIVNAFTGGEATVNFRDGVLIVKVRPPTSSFVDFSVKTLNEELLKRKPAHLLLRVELDYIAWETVIDNFSSWGDVRDKFSSWEDLYLYYIEEEGNSL